MQTTIHSGLVDIATDTVARFARRLAEHRKTDHPEAWAVNDLELIGKMATSLDSIQAHYIELAREQGASWSTIGTALGTSAQGAQQWYARRSR